MEIVNGTVVLANRACHCVNHPAGFGKTYNIKYCQHYTKAQGKHNCTRKTCPNNPKKEYGWHEISRTVETCGSCGGTGSVAENYCDQLTLPADFPIKVVRADRYNNFIENYLALGMLWSCQDYGQAAKMTDDEVITAIRQHESRNGDGRIQTQAVNVVRSKEDLRLADFLLVNVTRDGYSVRAGYNDK